MKKDSSKKGGNKAARKQKGPLLPRAEVRLHAAPQKAIQVRHLDAPRAYARRENIHPRRILPRVREGTERDFHSATSPVAFNRPPSMAAVVRAANDDLTLATNTELAEPGIQHLASNVDEPSVAANNRVVLYTGNWYAARSADGGRTFQYIDPFNAFPDPPNLDRKSVV